MHLEDRNNPVYWAPHWDGGRGAHEAYSAERSLWGRVERGLAGGGGRVKAGLGWGGLEEGLREFSGV